MEYMNGLKNFILRNFWWKVFGGVESAFILANIFVLLEDDSLFHWIYNYTAPHFTLTKISIFLAFLGIYYYLDSKYIEKIQNDYYSSRIDDTLSFTQLIAVPLNHSFISLLLACNLLTLYGGLYLSPNLGNLADQFILISFVGFPIALYIFIVDKLNNKMIEKDYNEAFEEHYNDVIDIKAVSRKLDENITEGANTGELVLANADNDELQQFIIKTLKNPEFSRESYHQNYAAFVIAEGETTVFNKEELEDMFEFQDELGIDLNSIDIGTFKLLNRTDTEYCTSVIFEYDYDLKIIGNMGLKGKVVNHSIMLWTENGWLFLTDTQEV